VFDRDTDIGKIIRASGAKGKIIAVSSDFRATIRITRPANKFLPFTTRPALARRNEWTMDPTYTSVYARHLAGEDVVYLADGNVGEATVGDDGLISDLPDVSRMMVGLKYVCDLQTLPLHDQNQPIEGRRKRVVRARIDQYNAVGLKVGANFDSMQDLKERKNEIMGEPTKLQAGYNSRAIAPKTWESAAAVCIRQENPLPATVRAIVIDAEIE
jgi:hypothetical protein